MSEQALWKIVGTAHTCEMLEILRDNGECMQSRITKKTRENDKRAFDKLKMLESHGLVTGRGGTSVNSDHWATHWSITSKGRALLISLEQSYKVLNGEISLEDLEGPQ